MKLKFASLLIGVVSLAAVSSASAQVSVGIGIAPFGYYGGYAPPVVYAPGPYYAPPIVYFGGGGWGGDRGRGNWGRRGGGRGSRR
jgi:hypothetical protein